MQNSLTLKQEAFCKAYILTGDKSAAYRSAYNTENMKPESVHRKAFEAFENVNVSARIKELQAIAAEIAEKEFQVTATEMLRHLNILRNARIDQYVNIEYDHIETEEIDDQGDIIILQVPRVRFKSFAELTEEQLMCIESVKEGRNGIELKLHGKEWSIEKINKHIGFYEKDNKQKSAEVVIFEIPNNDRD